MVKSVMHAEPTAEEIREFETVDAENRLAEEEFEREISAAKGEQTQSQIDPLDGCDPRDQRVRDTERDARLRYRDYDDVIKPVESLIRRSPHVFTVLRDSIDAGTAAYTLGQLLANPKLADHPKYKGFEEYLREVADRKTGTFDNLSVEAFEKMLDAFKASGESSLDEFFDKED